ncbi:GNAT family N-acetyltransferase [Rhodococcus sp. CH91]|uniref:GNAT family N-acetyltransferase n=1 Tax=Rhodococcus sp. CH91 TaxID=2910256 RepID=UPI001F4BBEF7|nr:GNAT family N-acetyltransferase [Rhodococcus sp. CH91]
MTGSILDSESPAVPYRTRTFSGLHGPVRVTTPAPRDAWREIARADPSTGPSQIPEWLECACASEGWIDASRLYETREGRRMVVPLVRRPAVRFPSLPARLDIYASMPHGWSVGGILAPGGVTVEDIEAVAPDLAATSGARIMIRPGFSAVPSWSEAMSRHGARLPRRCDTGTSATYILDLDGGFDAVWETRFSPKARSGIRNARRKAAEAGLVIECGSSPQSVADFYDVYLRWLDRRAVERNMPLALARRLGRRREPLRRFETVARVFGEQSRIWVASLDGVPVAAAYAVYHEGVGMGWRAYSDRDLAGNLRAHELLQVSAIEHACRLGCRIFDMGQTGGVSGLEHVKRRFGGVVHPTPEVAWEGLPLSSLGRGFVALRRTVERGSLALHQRRAGNGHEL